jgi:hypothetical protein
MASVSDEVRGKMEALVNTINTTQEEDDRIAALREIFNMTRNDDYLVPLASPSLGLLQALAGIIGTYDGRAREYAVRCCYNLSASDANRVSLASLELGLVKLLLDIGNQIIAGSCEDLKDHVYGYFGNVSFEPKNHDVLLDRSLGYVDFLLAVANKPSEVAWGLQLFSNIAANLSEDKVEVMISTGIQQKCFDILSKSGSNPQKWEEGGVGGWSIGVYIS